MLSSMSRKEDQQNARRDAARIADGIVRGDLDLIEGCLDLVASLIAAGLERDKDALTLTGFCSDADAFPRSRARHLWDARALADNDAERARYIERWRDRVMAACRTLLTTLRDGHVH
jgi:hypothetical protein